MRRLARELARLARAVGRVVVDAYFAHMERVDDYERVKRWVPWRP